MPLPFASLIANAVRAGAGAVGRMAAGGVAASGIKGLVQSAGKSATGDIGKQVTADRMAEMKAGMKDLAKTFASRAQFKQVGGEVKKIYRGAPVPPPVAGAEDEPIETGKAPPVQEPNRVFDSVARKFAVLAPLVGKAVAPFGLLAGVVTGAVAGLEKFGKGLLMGQETLRRFDPTMGVVFARYEHFQLQQNIKSARATSDSASFLEKGMEDLVSELRPIKDSITNLLNYTIGFAAKTASWGVWLARLAAKANPMMLDPKGFAEMILGIDEQKLMKQGIHHNFINDMMHGRFGRPHNKRPPFRAGGAGINDPLPGQPNDAMGQMNE